MYTPRPVPVEPERTYSVFYSLHQTIQLCVYSCRFVSDKMGGSIDRGQVANFSWELPLSQLKYDLKSNVIPLGMIKAGIHYHRALLFKVIKIKSCMGCFQFHNLTYHNHMCTNNFLPKRVGNLYPVSTPGSLNCCSYYH